MCAQCVQPGVQARHPGQGPYDGGDQRQRQHAKRDPGADGGPLLHRRRRPQRLLRRALLILRQEVPNLGRNALRDCRGPPRSGCGTAPASRGLPPHMPPVADANREAVSGLSRRFTTWVGSVSPEVLGEIPLPCVAVVDNEVAAVREATERTKKTRQAQTHPRPSSHTSIREGSVHTSAPWRTAPPRSGRSGPGSRPGRRETRRSRG